MKKELLKVVLRTLVCIAVGLYYGQHLKSKSQMAIFLGSAILLVGALYSRYHRARKAFQEAWKRYEDAVANRLP